MQLYKLYLELYLIITINLIEQMETIKQIYAFNKIKYGICSIVDSKQTDFINVKILNDLSERIVSQQHHNLEHVLKLFRKIITQNAFNSFKILKMLLILHSCVEKLKTLQDLLKFQDNVQQISDNLIQIQRIASNNIIGYDQKQTKIDFYYRKNILLPFCWNILKRIEFLKLYKFHENQKKNNHFIQGCFQSISLIELDLNQKLHYKAINNIKAITATQIHFYQIGRYYSTHKLINNLFIEYLKDLSEYLIYIREKCQTYANEMFQVSTNKFQSNHLLIVQSQKILNSVFSFYYNKYLFSKIQMHVKLQISLNLPQNYYQLQKTMKKQKIIHQSYIKNLSKRFSSCQKHEFSQRKSFNRKKYGLDVNTDIETDSSQNEYKISKKNDFEGIFYQIASLNL